MRPNLAFPLLPILLAVVLVVPNASAAVATVNLGTAGSFAVLAGAGITNTGSTTITGDVGSHPTNSQTGFGPGANSVTLLGASVNHHDDAVTQGAKADLVTAYNDAAGRVATPIPGGELGGLVLVPGVYSDANNPDSLALTGTLTLNGLGDPDSVFIFQSGSTLITASDSNVVLTNGAQACNIFWQVTSSATLGTNSHLEGTILALTSITLNTGATLDGRALARNGAVTMDTNTIQVVPCASVPPKADLVVQDITLTPSNPVSGDSVTFAATVQNVGNADAGAFTVHFLLDGVVSLGDREVAGLAADASITVTSDAWSALEGGHTITVTADALGQVAEGNEDNNARSEGFSVRIAIPFFPSLAVAVLASFALIGGLLLLRRRR
jgi:ice-binding like protein/CARDB protein